MAKLNVVYFGTCGLIREWCPWCKDESLVVDGEFTCCGASFDEEGRSGISFKVGSAPSGERKTPRKEHSNALLEITANRCVYCGHKFGTVAFRKGKPVALRLHWDHFIPFCLTQSNPDCNFLPACHICNGIKSGKIFQDLASAREYTKKHRERKGYDYVEEASDVSWMPTPNLSAAEEQALLLRQMQIQSVVEATSSPEDEG